MIVFWIIIKQIDRRREKEKEGWGGIYTLCYYDPEVGEKEQPVTV
jgi:hypothetical protein